ncbi:hypothetical protein [Microbacterium sp.]|uniref:hypothetical protein n=1 Tax=Microbacterium sp. TaxID=51671 RepID=UPI000926AF14|nr:hypothetical protein [Microbacterium sp.]MBN9181202.1 hypothetical protein [Microbacterium sp.]MBN9186608.1 hypothetical protein [Microbacterium sp.]MBN9191297.1 hypothetical protein [Microbacterium sp.]OJU70814.1 MAG: hypothetical protein BGO04_07105 [Microbacterium sp. 70-38]
MRKNIASLALLAALGATALTGCSAFGGTADGKATGGAASGQSVAEACSVAQTSMADVQTDMSDSLSGLGKGDVTGAVDAMNTLGEKFDEVESKVTNAKVKSALTDMGDKISEFGDLLASAKDGGLQALADKADKIQSISTDIQNAGKKLSDLCS